jgi:hypothetical protein
MLGSLTPLELVCYEWSLSALVRYESLHASSPTVHVLRSQRLGRSWLKCVLITQSILTMPKIAREKLPSTHRPPQSSKSVTCNQQP